MRTPTTRRGYSARVSGSPVGGAARQLPVDHAQPTGTRVRRPEGACGAQRPGIQREQCVSGRTQSGR